MLGQVPHQDLSKRLYFVLKRVLGRTRWKALLEHADRITKLALAQGHHSGPDLDKSLVLLRNGLRNALVKELGIDKVISVDQVHE